jgi:hypothetical protein
VQLWMLRELFLPLLGQLLALFSSLLLGLLLLQ